MGVLGIVVACGFLSLIVAFLYSRMIKQSASGTPKMEEIAQAIREGALAFLKREYKFIAIFLVVMFFVLLFTLDNKQTSGLNEGVFTAFAFLVGALCSVLAGFIGMKTATTANVKTAQGAIKNLDRALRIAFSSGAVMGLCVVGLGVIGLSVIISVYGNFMDTRSVFSILTGFGLGASSVALFARVGGGIYTKAADVGADLVGKIEAGIPEDDPRNPAVIADLVGDNVGDVAGMGADLYESYVGSIIAALVIGYPIFAHVNRSALLFPLLLAGVGIIASIVGTLFVRIKEGANIHAALKRGLWVASAIVILGSLLLTTLVLPTTYAESFGGAQRAYTQFGVFIAIVAGLVAGIIIGLLTEYYTSADYSPTKKVAQSAQTGSATVVIAGIALGFGSTFWSVITLCAAIWVAYGYAGLYGIGVAALGMLSTLGISLAVDAYGPVADNAGGIAQMANLPAAVRKRTDSLDSAGNTTAAIGKGFAIGSAALTALALFAAYAAAVGLSSINLLLPEVIIGLLLGAMLPFLFCSLTMRAVGEAAFEMIEEVRRQFKKIPGLLKGEGRANYAQCVDISTRAAVKKMIVPGLIAIIAPLAIGIGIGPQALGGLLAGSLGSGVVLAISMANSGGSWDNAKKYIESGKFGGKGKDAHKAAVVGDTVGDPFKDTSGPSLNILIKLMSIVALVFVPLLLQLG